MKNQSKGKVLIVDDVKADINILQTGLKDEFDVSIAFDGEDALDKAVKDPPDLILLDILMPNIDGYEVFNRLNMDELTKNIPIVFITSKIGEKEETKGLELGAIDYISKPFSMTIVKARVKNIVKMRQQQNILASLSSIDGLTGIANRRQFDQRLDQEWKRSVRGGTFLSLIMMDIDFFKKYNDYYGHAAGDECLKSVARTVAGSLSRSQDLAARFGGEEFSVILPETQIKGASLIGERIKQNVKNLRIPHAQSTVSDYVTISAGIAGIAPSINMAPRVLIECADSALYKAKQGSRNLCQIYNTEGMPQQINAKGDGNGKP